MVWEWVSEALGIWERGWDMEEEGGDGMAVRERNGMWRGVWTWDGAGWGEGFGWGGGENGMSCMGRGDVRYVCG